MYFPLAILANVNVISQNIPQQLYNKYIMSDTRLPCENGGGYITCQQFISFSVSSDAVKLHHDEFYIIPDLPFEYLTGRPLLGRVDMIWQKFIPHEY